MQADAKPVCHNKLPQLEAVHAQMDMIASIMNLDAEQDRPIHACQDRHCVAVNAHAHQVRAGYNMQPAVSQRHKQHAPSQHRYESATVVADAQLDKQWSALVLDAKHSNQLAHCQVRFQTVEADADAQQDMFKPIEGANTDQLLNLSHNHNLALGQLRLDQHKVYAHAHQDPMSSATEMAAKQPWQGAAIHS